MKIGKKFSMTISGKFQSYTFSTVVEVDESVLDDTEVAGIALARLARRYIQRH